MLLYDVLQSLAHAKAREDTGLNVTEIEAQASIRQRTCSSSASHGAGCVKSCLHDLMKELFVTVKSSSGNNS